MSNLPRVAPDEVKKMKRLRKAGLSYVAIGRAVGWAPGTVRGYILGILTPVTKSAADYQAEARAVPERTLGPDPPIELDNDLSRVGRAEDDEIPEGAEQRMMDIQDGKWAKSNRNERKL